MQPPKISTILVQYNNSSDVVKCFESLKKSDYPNLDIIIVDNASDQSEIDATQSYLNSLESRIENQELSTKSELDTYYLILTSNLGYSGGNNVGIKHALDHGADYILVLNPDTTLEKDAISEMLKVFNPPSSNDFGEAKSDPKIGIVGPVIEELLPRLNLGKEVQPQYRRIHGGKIEWLKPELNHSSKKLVVRNREEKNNKLFDSYYLLLNSDFLTGACLLIKREVFEKLGLFDERYFLYFEDADLCVRVQKTGHKLAIAGKAVIHHQVSVTTSKLGAARLLRYHYRNAHLFNMKHAPLGYFILLPFWSIQIIIKQLSKIFVGRNKEISKEILSGVLDFYKGRFGKI